MKHGLMGIGMVIIAMALLVMVDFHEYVISEGVFLIGIVIVGIAWTMIPESEKPKVNTKQVNENIQKFNDIIWGEEKKPPKEPEPQIKIVIFQKK
jgi:outer membrane biosynthesis protein TonB